MLKRVCFTYLFCTVVELGLLRTLRIGYRLRVCVNGVVRMLLGAKRNGRRSEYARF